MELRPFIRRHGRCITGGLSAAAMAASLGACGFGESAAPGSRPTGTAATSTSATPEQRAIPITPDMSGFLLDPGHCAGGGPRPCAVQLRTQPNIDAPKINVDPNDVHVSWPLEAYGGQPGDALPAKCFISDGQPLSSADGLPASPYWYEVYVTDEDDPQGNPHIRNPEVRGELTQHSNKLIITTFSGKTAIIGFMSVEWEHQTVPDETVPRCAA